MEPTDVPTAALDLDLDERFLSDPWGTWKDLRAKHAVFRAIPGTPAGNDVWVCTREAAIRDAYKLGPEYFSNQILFPYTPVTERQLGLVQMDPPEHTVLRRAMSPLFGPGVIDAMRPRMHELCREIIGEFIGDGGCEYVSQFAKRYVAAVFMEYLGVPLDQLDDLLRWAYDVVHLTVEQDPDRSRLASAMGNIRAMMAGLADARKADPADDLVTAMVRIAAELDLPETDLHGTLVLLFLGGLDTTAGSLSFAARHFAENPADRAVATKDQESIANATEEILRAFGILNATKLVVKDVELRGCPMKSGDRIVLATSSAGRDEAVFEDAESVRFDRDSYRHIAFGLGPHRCIGSHLARAEIQIFIEEWNRMIPDYWVADPAGIHTHGGTVMGIDKLPLAW